MILKYIPCQRVLLFSISSVILKLSGWVLKSPLYGIVLSIKSNISCYTIIKWYEIHISIAIVFVLVLILV